MKKLLLSLAAVSALAAGAPAVAAPARGPIARAEVSRADVFDLRIQRLVERHQIGPREARSLRAQVQDVRKVEWRYGRDGRITRAEQVDLDHRFDRIQDRLRHASRDYGFLSRR